jgi:hypothetical protein
VVVEEFGIFPMQGADAKHSTVQHDTAPIELSACVGASIDSELLVGTACRGVERTHLDDGHNIACGVAKLSHVHDEMLQLVSLRLLQHQLRPLADSIDTAQIGHRVDMGIGGLGQLYGGDRRRRAHGGLRRRNSRDATFALWKSVCLAVCLAAGLCELTALPTEKTHDSWVDDARRRVQMRAVGDRRRG